MNTVYTENLPVLPYNKAEIMRYSGVKNADMQFYKLQEECLALLEGKIKNRVCYCEFDVSRSGRILDLGFTKTDSQLLLKKLNNCNKIMLFAATIGIELDRFIAKYSRMSPAKAVLLDAIGTERIETLCDSFEDKIRNKYKSIVPRVSPGYGDISLYMQNEIISALDCQKRIGLYLNSSLLMLPTKSVTGIIGIV